MRLVKAILLFLAAIVAAVLSVITAISAITLSIPQIDPKMQWDYKVSYTIGFIAFPVVTLVLSIFIFLKGKSFLKVSLK